jgi:hypothetical protein
MKDDDMGRGCSVHEICETAHKTSIINHKGKRLADRDEDGRVIL